MSKVTHLYSTLEVSLANLSKFLQTLSVVSRNTNNQGINAISATNSPNFIKYKQSAATINNGNCSRCDSSRPFHLNKIKDCRYKKTKGTVNIIQGPVTDLAPTPRISGTIIQNGSTKGHISVLPDSGSVAEVIPKSLASF